MATKMDRQKDEKIMKREKKLPGKVGWQVVDAWLAIPPCNYQKDPYCHVQCPYFYECYTPEEEDYDC